MGSSDSENRKSVGSPQLIEEYGLSKHGLPERDHIFCVPYTGGMKQFRMAYKAYIEELDKQRKPYSDLHSRLHLEKMKKGHYAIGNYLADNLFEAESLIDTDKVGGTVSRGKSRQCDIWKKLRYFFSEKRILAEVIRRNISNKKAKGAKEAGSVADVVYCATIGWSKPIEYIAINDFINPKGSWNASGVCCSVRTIKYALPLLKEGRILCAIKDKESDQLRPLWYGLNIPYIMSEARQVVIDRETLESKENLNHLKERYSEIVNHKYYEELCVKMLALNDPALGNAMRPTSFDGTAPF
jgi:hypothetical protein